MHRAFDEGVSLFNERKFFEAHEALESVWLKAEGEEKIFLHGLIQVAAAFHHFSKGNRAGFHSLLEKGALKLERFGDSESGIALAEFRRQLAPWRRLATNAPPEGAPSLPRISRTSDKRRAKKAQKGEKIQHSDF